ncbi:thiamine pyrophosphate-dependent enzyme [Succinivibrio dextrinosolvens]|uniref:thiamine pyrophosphate-dependent enzyme n=1 Tax=Succinivibrio dextrinosolvens TaxID=83771 RepID=UPI0004E20480|nr:thiamine pyrophosphate-dependent enzyme [Succinivibrio dextrinosolvens]
MLEQLKKMRKLLLKISSIGKDGNLQSCFSSLEILWTLYDKFIPLNASVLNGNKFVLSKGQSNLALLVVLSEKNIIEQSELLSFCKFDSRISMQADRTKFNGEIEVSAGSLGHGLPIAVGLAWAKKIKGENGKIFCLVGDGELNEGTIWESLLFASSEKLNNLVVIVDNNHSVGRMIDFGNIEDKLNAFGMHCINVNGHDVNALFSAFDTNCDKPVAVIAETQRGWGSKTLMEDRSWFHRFPTSDELISLYDEVDKF